MNYHTKRRTRPSSYRPVSQLKPESLVKKSTTTIVKPYASTRKFDDLNLHSMLTQNIALKGYQSPSEIQDKCIDHLAEGKSLIGIAATGTGKTGAFLIPIIHQMLCNDRITALVVVPTRELAQQIYAEFRSLTHGTHLKAACFIGGTSVGKDMSLARKRMDLVVGTPGRLNDLIDRRALNIGTIPTLVLDEFDRMLDMGFEPQIRRIVFLSVW